MSPDPASPPTPSPSPSAPVPTPAPATSAEPADALAAAHARMADLERQLGRARADLAASQRAGLLRSMLAEAGAVDVDAAQALLEPGLTSQDQPDVAAAVRDLRRRKPRLFAAPPASAAGVMGAGPHAAGPSAADLLAEAAARTGDRRTLLGYLRARRAP